MEPEISNEQPCAECKCKKKRIYITIGAVALVLVIGIVFAICARPGENGGGLFADGNHTEEETEPVSTEPTIPPVHELSEELLDFTFRLDGDLYRLPCELTAFTDKGWAFETDQVGLETMINGISSETYTLVRGECSVRVSSYNLSGNAKPLSECLVGGVECAVNQNTEFCVSQEIAPGMSADEIIEAFGEPDESYDTTYTHVLTYNMGEAENQYVRFSDYFTKKDREYSCITLKNFVPRASDVTPTDLNEPEYLQEYKAPAELGDTLLSGTICLEGVVYALPVPLKTLVADGFTIQQKPEYVVAGGLETMVLQKGESTVEVEIKNFSLLQTLPENCAVTGLTVYSDSGLDLQLPAGINLKSTKNQVKKVINDKFFAYDSVLTLSYEYYEYEQRELAIKLIIGKTKNVMSGIYVSCETWGDGVQTVQDPAE